MTRQQVWGRAWPVILANAATPLLGLTDTAILGRTASTTALAGLALAVLVFNFLFWGFGFLRMSTTGLIAQHMGSGNTLAAARTLLRAQATALALAALLIAAQGLLGWAAFTLLQAGPQVEAEAWSYFQIRIWGAPATLALYVFSGLLIGLGQGQRLLALQLGLNGLNVLFDLLFAWGLDLDLIGVALGTVLAEWTAAAVFAGLAWRSRRGLVAELYAEGAAAVFGKADLRQLFANNRDLFVRSLLLLGGFAWFINKAAGFGAEALAACHILLQLIAFSAFVLDGFAFVAEAEVGRSIGARNAAGLRRAVRLTSECAGFTALLLGGLVAWWGLALIDGLTTLPAVQSLAKAYLPFAACYIVCSVAAFQLDGIFIGAMATRAMRNASLGALAGFIGLYYASQTWGLSGLWLSFIGYVGLRAVLLALAYPGLYRATTASTAGAASAPGARR